MKTRYSRQAWFPCRVRIGPSPPRYAVRASRETFGALEIGKHFAVAPARRPHRDPALVVERVAAHEHHAVDGRRAAQHPAPRSLHAPAVQPRLRHAPVVPVETAHAHRLPEGGGHVEPDTGGLPARLEEQNAGIRILAQTMGEHAAGGSCADDDVVEFPVHFESCILRTHASLAAARGLRSPVGADRDLESGPAPKRSTP